MKAGGWALAVWFAGVGAAQGPSPWTQQFSGYFKDLASGSRSYVTQEAWGDNLDRLRLTYDGKYGDRLGVHVDYDNEAHAGNFMGTPDSAVVRERQSAAWLGLRHVVVNGEAAYWDMSLYRGYVTARAGGVTVTAGRQRIGWGTARFWSPMDMFNPISPLEIEPGERQGVDAALLAWRWRGALRWNAVYAPQDGFRRSTSAVRVGRTIHNYDVDVAVARFGEDWTAGGDFAGQFRGAGLRGEMTYRWRHATPGVMPVASGNALRVAAGSDYAFANGLYVVGEYFYNQGQPNGGTNRAAELAALLRYSNEIFTRKRHFVSGGASYSITPLWKVEGYVVADVAGPSAAWLPRLSYNLTANTDLAVGAQGFVASSGGEFQGLSPLVYVEFVVHFR